MEIIYLGHSSFKISTKTASVITDPYKPETVGLKFPKQTATMVTVSHEHDDHNYLDGVTDVKKVISGPGEYEIDDISVIGIASYHDDKKGEERGKNTLYVFELEGFRLVHLGDLGHTLSESVITAIGEIDVAMVPVGGYYTIGPEDAAKVVHSIEPKYVIPMHYQVPGLREELSANLSGVDAFIAALGATSEEMPKLVLRAGSIMPEDHRVVVLQKK